MRVYLPSTLPALRELLDTGALGSPPLPAYAVTGALREWYAEGDDEAAEQDVRAAAEQLVEADLGSEDAAFVVDQAEGHELQWYATQEIGPLLELG